MKNTWKKERRESWSIPLEKSISREKPTTKGDKSYYYYSKTAATDIDAILDPFGPRSTVQG